MKIKYLLILVGLIFQIQVEAQVKQDLKILKDSISGIEIQNKWFETDYTSIQFAGNIGFLSAGLGFELFKERLNVELIYGFVPVYNNRKAIHTFTLKTFMPICSIKWKKYSLAPYGGFTTSYETGRHSFVKLPDRFPDGYYKPNAVHFTALVGVKLNKKLANGFWFKSVDVYFELGAVDSYLWYAISNKEVKLNDVFSSALGLNFYF